ncbi:MAG: hypothetical protein QXG39_06230 [Candidatus Aenigmatarchaeota archaeon]
MYIKAIIEDPSGNKEIVEMENKASPIPPDNTLGFLKYSTSTIGFLLKFQRKLKKKLKEGFKIVEIQTDIPYFGLDSLYSDFGVEEVKKLVKVMPKVEE